MKKTLIFYSLFPFIVLISLLPFPVLYFISDGLYLLVYQLIGYRKKVVFTNLTNSFPDKSAAEIEEIAQKFYRFLCDFLLENFKSMTMSEKEIRKRCTFANQDFLDQFSSQQRSGIGVLGHYGNWEWAAPAFSVVQNFQLFVIYKKLSNTHFDKMMLRIRSKFGTKLIEMNDVVKAMFKNKDIFGATIFVGDQTPFPESAYWTRFLNQDTAVFKGTEVIAKKFNLPVVWISVKRVKRGYYEVHTELLCDQPSLTTDGEISELHIKRLEKDINEQPELWLWSHRRWKHKKPIAIK